MSNKRDFRSVTGRSLGLVLAAAALFAAAATGPAVASEVRLLAQPDDVASVSTSGVDAQISYDVIGPRYRVSMTFTSTDGNNLRTWVALTDGQRHEVVLHDDNDAQALFAVRRVGSVIEISTGPSEVGSTLATN